MTLSSRVESGLIEDRPGSVAKLIVRGDPQALRTHIGMSTGWEVASATQISRSGAAETGTLATQVANHIGGSGRV